MPKARRKRKISPMSYVVKKIGRTEKNDFGFQDDKPRTDFDHDSLNQSNPVTPRPSLLRTPSPDLSSIGLFEEESRIACSLDTTPKNTKNNLSHRFSHRLAVNGRDSIFYQSKICGVTPLYCDDEKVDQKGSTIDDNVSYFKERKIFSNTKMVAEKFGDVKLLKEINKIDSIFETPKIKSDPVYNEKVSHKLHDNEIAGPKNIKGKRSLCRSKSENEIMLHRGLVNINPYINYDNMQLKSFQENTVNELSFFTPELLKSKPASTPIHCNSERNVPRKPLSDVNNDPISLSIKRRNYRTNSSVQPLPLAPLLKKEKRSEIQNVKKNIEVPKKVYQVLSRTAPVGKSKSPRKIVHYARGPIRLHKNYMSCSYKSLIEESKSSSKDDTLGALRKILKRVQNYGTATAKWTMSLFSVCTRLGYSLKTGISTLCATCERNVDESKICNCNQYQKEIGKLNIKINELGTNLSDLRSQLLENIQKHTKIETLTATLEKISKDVETLKLLKEEMDSLRQQFLNIKKSTSLPSWTPVAPKAPPPPPPPLPPPLPPTSALLQINKSVGTVKKNSSKNKVMDGTPRPTISLEDILKVKLKKTVERQAPTRRINTNQPEVSLEMLQQVKLRKSISRTMTPSSLPEISSDGSTSPHSSLKRLLRDDSSLKVKRLRRVGGYSLDGIHKKNVSKLNRERD